MKHAGTTTPIATTKLAAAAKTCDRNTHSSDAATKHASANKSADKATAVRHQVVVLATISS